MSFGKEVDEDGEIVTPDKLEYVLHFFAFMWKIIFALIPPATTLGGYPSFVLSLLTIGAITAVIEQVLRHLDVAIMTHYLNIETLFYYLVFSLIIVSCP